MRKLMGFEGSEKNNVSMSSRRKVTHYGLRITDCAPRSFLLSLSLLLCASFSAIGIEIKYRIPEDGYVSMIIRNSDGLVVRQPLTCEFRRKGKHVVDWDGRLMPVAGEPGETVSPGSYTWSAIYHQGIGLRLRGWAYHGPSDPWDSSPTSYWGGDHGQPIACATDGENVYLGWSGAEAGKALIAMGPDDNVIWAAGFHFNSAEQIAADSGVVFYPSSKVLKRVSAKDGKLDPWPGTRSGEIPIHALLGDPDGTLGMPSTISGGAEGMDAHNGKLYLCFSVWTIHRHHIRDWRRFLANVRKGGRAADAIWQQIDARSQKTIERWFVEGGPEDQALGSPHYKIPDVRKVVVDVMRAQLYNAGLAPGGSRNNVDSRTRSNRKFLEKAFPDDLVPLHSDFIAVIDIETGKLIRRLDIPSPGRISVVRDDLAYVFSERNRLLKLNPLTGETEVVMRDLRNFGGMTTDDAGNIYIGFGYPDYQVFVFNPEGVELRRMGKRGGRVNFGPWSPEGMSVAYGVAVDAKGRVWVAENDSTPKRFSVWDGESGEFIDEHLGPTHYGASGAAINPVDPDLMLGEGMEWRIDPETGRSKLLGIAIHEIPYGASRYCRANGERLYLAGTFKKQISIWERLEEARYAYRAVIRPDPIRKRTIFWADMNGDQAAQSNEIRSYPAVLGLAGYNTWSMNMNTDLTFYGVDAQGKRTLQFRVGKFTPCGAPLYDLENPRELPKTTAPLSSPDNRLIASCDYDNYFRCFDIDSGKLLWTYPNAFHGVHGSHYAPGPASGFIRGAFGFVGSALLPEPLGAIWAINTNVGEWHVLTEDGYYLTALFETDEQKQRWPKAVPGAVMDDCPAGLGGEDFGGSLVQGVDGKVYVQAGKLAVWNLGLVGLETVKELGGGEITLEADDIPDAPSRTKAPAPILTVKRMKPEFTGDLIEDFSGGHRIPYPEDSTVTSSAAWDDEFLYLAWQVKDLTPWVNGADDAAYLYASGDTVDFQVATDPKADPDRERAVRGDLRISIGKLRGTTTVVLYEEAARKKKLSRTFSSGVQKDFVVRRVEELMDVVVKVTTRQDEYTVEAAIPLETLGLEIKPGQDIAADMGATFGDKSGADTARRHYWSNRNTGIVDDEVFELRVEPRNWGKMVFVE